MTDLKIDNVLYPVGDLEAAKRVYTALVGADPMADSPYYVGYDVAGVQLGLVPAGGPQSPSTPVATWSTPDVAAAVEALVAAGATLVQEPHDVGGGALVATLTDADGNTINLISRPQG